jgi:hypothetical protein
LRASRTLIFPEADTVDEVESNSVTDAKASHLQSGGVCDAGMHKIAQPRNLGDPEYSHCGKGIQRTGVYLEGIQEVRPRHSTEEAE